MQSIIIVLDSEKLDNPDLDILTQLPVRVEEVTDDKIYDNGYDYLDDNKIAIWLACKNAKEDVYAVIDILKNEKFSGNDLSKTAEIYWSSEDSADIEESELISI